MGNSSELTAVIIAAAMEVHRVLGPGLLESAYEGCLEWELVQRSLRVERQVWLPVRYKEMMLDQGYRMDLLVEGAVVVELKTVRAFEAIHTAQMLTYLRLSGCRVGLIFNFFSPVLKQGIKRVIL